MRAVLPWILFGECCLITGIFCNPMVHLSMSRKHLERTVIQTLKPQPASKGGAERCPPAGPQGDKPRGEERDKLDFVSLWDQAGAQGTGLSGAGG
ncbi:hypothetical protein SKAU_G00211740 [Synaphobranchus kaupii]|uniref:Uncharacterized protein n=1 Tax=Synaphobranchus kaupii TaxID=118154 RepID=A0A9Q1F984_SYNKA|nr:hypothetical protein SKAU_G00211740 [Synaphobranchus kaupii]